MYAIIETGGKQYKVVEGQKLKVEKLPFPENDVIEIREVLFVSNGEKAYTGTPFVQGAAVKAKVLSHGRAKKIIVFKYKRRKDYKKKIGHRQHYTELLIEKISLEGEHGS
ncbi:MAG: 50S ribosomal protein L21 [Desulfobacterota bacterium]|nr:50S ribosomal protein L21 [Thermodesulfobacteriota bacterium]MDW8002182.1 50S ribosomal protein L21 [Deltaproteobacteria bacterium]